MSNYSVSRPANHSRIIPIIPIVTNPNDSKSQLENVTVVEKNLDKAKTEAIDVKTRDNLFRDLMMAEVRGFKKVVERLTHRFASKVDSYNDYAAYANHMAEGVKKILDPTKELDKTTYEASSEVATILESIDNLKRWINILTTPAELDKINDDQSLREIYTYIAENKSAISSKRNFIPEEDRLQPLDDIQIDNKYKELLDQLSALAKYENNSSYIKEINYAKSNVNSLKSKIVGYLNIGSNRERLLNDLRESIAKKEKAIESIQKKEKYNL